MVLRSRVGEIFSKAGDHEGCVRSQRRALALNEHHLPAMLQLGLCLKELNDINQAFATFAQLRRLHPSMAGLKRLKQWMAVTEVRLEKRDQLAAKAASSRARPTPST